MMKAYKGRGRPCSWFGLWLVVAAGAAVLAAGPCGAFVLLSWPCAKQQTTLTRSTAPSLLFLTRPNDSDDEAEPVVPREKAPDDERINEQNDNDAVSSSPLFAFSPMNTTPEMKLPPRWKLIVAYLGFVSFWPLLAAVQVYLRTHEFDVDTYLTVKGLLDTAAPLDNGSDATTIMELPPLSPAERLVDSLFGPNKNIIDPRGGF